MFVFLGPLPRYMEVPRLGVKLELKLPAYTTTTATWDPSHTCDLQHSSWWQGNLNPLSEARDETWILKDTSQICFCCTTVGTPMIFFFSYSILNHIHSICTCISIHTHPLQTSWMHLFRPDFWKLAPDPFTYTRVFDYFIWLFRATPMAFGSSQARGRIGAAAAGLHLSHSNDRSKLCLWCIPQLTAMLDP